MNDNNSDQDKKGKLFELIDGIEIGMLVTVSSHGDLRSRPMSVRTTDTDHYIWFLTDKDSAKVLEIENHCRVNVSFSRPSDFTFVSVSGTATLSDDRNKIDEIWTADAGIWFPEGKDDPRLTLIRVEPTDAEYWCSTGNRFVNLFKIASAAIRGEQPNVGSNRKIDF